MRSKLLIGVFLLNLLSFNLFVLAKTSSLIFGPKSNALTVNHAGYVNLRGTLISISTSTLAVDIRGTNWHVNLSSSTLLRKHFGVKANISEMLTNDQVAVRGFISTTTSSTVDAKMVIDYSLQRRYITFYGVITRLSGNDFILQTKIKGNIEVKVNINQNTKIIINEKKMSATSLQNGAKATVWGFWDRTNSTIQAKKIRASQPRRPSS